VIEHIHHKEFVMIISPIRSTSAFSTSPRASQFALALIFMAGFFVTTAHAQVLVTDTVAISTSEEGFKSQLAQTVAQYTKQGLQYAKQLQEYETQLQQYQQLVMKVQGLGTNVTIMPNSLQQISDPSTLIAQNCPGPSGGSVVGTVVTSIASAFSPADSITKSQQAICAKMVTLQIDKYNKTVIILNDLNTYGGTLQQLNDLANQITNVGNASNTTSQAETVSATMARSMHDWETSVAGDDRLIEALNQQQQILAKVAMNGSPMGNVVQGAAFALAFHD
jgi:hypothetical protein